MKKNLMMTLFLIVMICGFLNAKENKNNNNLKTSNKVQYRKVSQTDEMLQKTLFTTLPTKCKPFEKELEEVQERKQKEKMFVKGSKTDMWWVKPWGYGQSAYFYDYLQPVLMEPFLEEAKLIYESVKANDNKKHGLYTDPFDYALFISEDMSDAEKQKIMSNLKLVNANYVKEVFDISINAVQLHKSMKEWKWTRELKTDYSKDIIDLYDQDGDGRLNIREFILAVIDYNKKNQFDKDVKFQFNEMISICDAIFTFVDCDENGYVSTEELYNNMKNLKRPNKDEYNIYGANKEVRLTAVNDFMLKCHYSKNGLLTREEFTLCIFYGFWNRQTTSTKFLKDNSRNLADLRWSGKKKDIAFERNLSSK